MAKPSKPSKAFQLPAEDMEEAPAPTVGPIPMNDSTDAWMVTVPTERPAYRKDRKNLSVWVDQKAFNAFKAMVAEEGSTIQDYVIKMINQEFAKKGRPLIAK